jgi:hypothetical protein
MAVAMLLIGAAGTMAVVFPAGFATKHRDCHRSHKRNGDAP